MSHCCRYILGVVIAAVAILVIGGCGGGSSTASTSDSSTADSSSIGTKAPSREFISKGGNNKWAHFGEVASDGEREAASKVLEENLQARQAGEWEAQCSSLTQKAMKELAPKAGSEPLVKACANALKAVGEPLKASAGVRKDNLPGEIDVLRVEGERAVALFHGSGSTNYGMSMEKEDGEWKVAAVLTAELN